MKLHVTEFHLPYLAYNKSFLLWIYTPFFIFSPEPYRTTIPIILFEQRNMRFTEVLSITKRNTGSLCDFHALVTPIFVPTRVHVIFARGRSPMRCDGSRPARAVSFPFLEDVGEPMSVWAWSPFLLFLCQGTKGFLNCAGDMHFNVSLIGGSVHNTFPSCSFATEKSRG